MVLVVSCDVVAVVTNRFNVFRVASVTIQCLDALLSEKLSLWSFESNFDTPRRWCSKCVCFHGMNDSIVWLRELRPLILRIYCGVFHWWGYQLMAL